MKTYFCSPCSFHVCQICWHLQSHTSSDQPDDLDRNLCRAVCSIHHSKSVEEKNLHSLSGEEPSEQTNPMLHISEDTCTAQCWAKAAKGPGARSLRPNFTLLSIQDSRFGLKSRTQKSKRGLKLYDQRNGPCCCVAVQIKAIGSGRSNTIKCCKAYHVVQGYGQQCQDL